jgi:hypothetical protein
MAAQRPEDPTPGDGPAAGRVRGSAVERITQRTSRTGGCWLWTGVLNRDGYAEIRIEGKYRMAHRVAYEELVGVIPEGLQLDHLCRVRHCVNPEHLEPVTPRVNNLRSESFAAKNAVKDQCHRGHLFTEANTLIYRGKRTCRACNRIRAEASRERRKRAKQS